MSITTWLAEFYPVSLRNAVKTDAAGIDHAILKFTGATAENLAKHNCSTKRWLNQARYVYDLDTCETGLWFNAQNCVLCYLHLNLGKADHCSGCPLNVNGQACPLEGSPDKIFQATGDPDAMLAALQAAKEAL